MTRALRLSFLAIAAISCASALLFVVLRHWPGPADEFSAYGHPAQPWALDLHIFSSAVLTLVLGFLFGVHVMPRWATERRARASGSLLVLLAALMLLSGALLPCCADEIVRAAVSWTHGISGTAFVLSIPWHIVHVRKAGADASPQNSAQLSVRATVGSGAPRLRARVLQLRRASRARDGCGRR